MDSRDQGSPPFEECNSRVWDRDGPVRLICFGVCLANHTLPRYANRSRLYGDLFGCKID